MTHSNAHPFSVFSLLCLFLFPVSLAAQGPMGPAPVEVEAAVLEDVAGQVSVTGSSTSWRESRVTSQTSGLVIERKIRVGQEVKKGDVLFLLDTEPLILELAALTAGMKDLEVRYKEAAARSDRSNKLFKKKHLSEENYQADLTAEASLGHQVTQAKAQIELLKDRVKRRTVRAPFDGVVLSFSTDVGGWLEPGDAVVRMIDLSHVKVILKVPEKWISSIDRDADVQLSADALPGVPVEGSLHAVVPEADPDSRTIPVIIKVPNPDRKLHSGMFFTAALSTTQKQKALLVPKDSLSKAGAAWSLFVVLGDKSVPMMVSRHEEYGTKVRVEGDLKPGMQVVVRGNERLRPGMPVRIKGQGDDPSEAPAGPPAESAE